MSTLGTCLLVLMAAAPARERAPTGAALRKAFELNRRAMVEVVGPHRSGPGVIVGASGQVLTSVDFVGLYDAKVRRDGKEHPAKVLLASADLKIAVLEIQPPGEFPAAPVHERGEVGKGSLLVGIGRSRKGDPTPVVGRVLKGASERSAFLEVGAPLPAGAPLFDGQGKLVAVSVGRRAGRACRALPVPAVKVQLARGPQP